MQLMLCSTPGVSAFPSSPENLLNWTATISGPSDTPYAALTFKLSFQFPSSYPYAPPTVLFKTPIFHPNVDFSGRICLDILKDKWSAVYNVQSVLLSLQSLLGEPNKYALMLFLICNTADLGANLCLSSAQVHSMVKRRSCGTQIPSNLSDWF